MLTPSKNFTLLLAFPGFEHELEAEILRHQKKIFLSQERLFVTDPMAERLIWTQTQGTAQAHSIPSISGAAKLLKSMGPRWACASPTLHRRSELIQSQVSKDKTPEIEFGDPVHSKDWGLWALLEENLLIAAPRTDHPCPRGELHFKESTVPPSRAYLKLWEAMSLHVPRPQPQQIVADFGSCPGGWTWVLASMAAKVYSIDKAPLDAKVAALKTVQFVKKDAFRVQPDELEPLDWFFSDIICEPSRLLELVERWRAAGTRNFVCTIKYKGQTDFATTSRFLEYPGSRVVHLNANKHEVTWILQT